MASIDVFSYVVAILFGFGSSPLTWNIEWNSLTTKQITTEKVKLFNCFPIVPKRRLETPL